MSSKRYMPISSTKRYKAFACFQRENNECLEHQYCFAFIKLCE